jgi:hypothetical protein
VVFGDPPLAFLLHQDFKGTEPQKSICCDGKTLRYFGETGHLPDQVDCGHVGTNETQLADGRFYRSALEDRLSSFDMTFLEFFPPLENGAEDAGETAILSEMIGGVAMNDSFDSGSVLCGRVLSGIVRARRWDRLGLPAKC